MIFKIDTSIVDKVNPILTIIIIVIMVISLFTLKKNTKDSLITIIFCAVILYVINDVQGFISLITQLITSIIKFAGGMLSE